MGEIINLNRVNTRTVIRQFILEMDTPFCLSDLFVRLRKKGVSDRELTLQVLDELYDDGLIEYVKVETDNGVIGAFRVKQF